MCDDHVKLISANISPRIISSRPRPSFMNDVRLVNVLSIPMNGPPLWSGI